MEKSWNDIHNQAERCVSMLHSNNDGYWRTPTQIRQIARRTAAKRGISIFEKDRDKKFPWDSSKFERPTPQKRLLWWQNEDGTMKQFAKIEPKPVVAKPKSMTMEERTKLERTMNNMCRHDMIHKILADITRDMVICKLSNWDMFEYPKMIKAEIERILSLKPKPVTVQPVQLNLFD